MDNATYFQKVWIWKWVTSESRKKTMSAPDQSCTRRIHFGDVMTWLYQPVAPSLFRIILSLFTKFSSPTRLRMCNVGKIPAPTPLTKIVNRHLCTPPIFDAVIGLEGSHGFALLFLNQSQLQMQRVLKPTSAGGGGEWHRLPEPTSAGGGWG